MALLVRALVLVVGAAALGLAVNGARKNGVPLGGFAAPATCDAEESAPSEIEPADAIRLCGHPEIVIADTRPAGPSPTRVTFRLALESLKNFDLGIGALLSFGGERHQGLDSVYFTRVDGERWVPIADWSAAIQA